MPTSWLLFFAAVLVVLNGFFVLSEYALVKSRQTRLQEMAEAGSAGAKRVLFMIDHLDAYISATQLGITLASLALGWLGEPAFANVTTPLVQRVFSGTLAVGVVHFIAVLLAFILITFLHTVLGENRPQGHRHPEGGETRHHHLGAGDPVPGGLRAPGLGPERRCQPGGPAARLPPRQRGRDGAF